jgi:hypothetical protein
MIIVAARANRYCLNYRYFVKAMPLSASGTSAGHHPMKEASDLIARQKISATNN